MKKRIVVLFLGFFGAGLALASASRPVHTYSIVAIDPASGQMGVAVQSHWFSVGGSVVWGESGVGVVATQSFVDPSYGALGLELMRRGKSAPDALKALLAADPTPGVRQVAMLDASGRVVAHTGALCISEAGQALGQGYSCQANMMEKATVWPAMAAAFEKSGGELADRLLAALDAAQAQGGDIRGRQSAALLVVRVCASGQPWSDKLFDLRVEDHPQPLAELRRLVGLAKAYNRMNKGDEYMAQNKVEEAMREYTEAMKMVPDNAEMTFWPAVTLATLGRVEESLPLFRRAFSMDRNWAELAKRLPAVGQLPKDERLMQRIQAELTTPEKKRQ